MPSRRVPQLSFSSRVTYCRSSGDFIGQDQVECGLNGRGKTSLLTYSIWARCPRRQRMGLDDGIASPWRDESADPTEAAAWRCRPALITPTMS